MKTERIEIRIADDIKTRYQAQADQRGVPLATWALNAMAEQFDREQTTGVLKIRKRELLAGDWESLRDEGHSTRDLSSLIGQTFYLIKTEYTLAGRGDDHWYLSTEPGRGNSSGRAIIRGWCGTTNDVAIYAEGRVIVTGQSRTHVHLGVLPDSEG